MNSFINIWSFLIQFVNIVIIIFILNKFLFKPYLKYLTTEEKKRKELEEAHVKLSEIKADALKEAKDIVDDAKKESHFIKDEAAEIAKEEALEIVNWAKDEADKIKVKAHLDIDNERKALYSDLKDKVLEVALRINEKLFSKSDVNADFIKTALENEKI